MATRRRLRCPLASLSVGALGLFFAAGLMLAVPCAAQITVTPTVASSGGSYTYTYQMANGGTGALQEFQLLVDGPVSTYTAPANWGVNPTDFGTQVSVEWLSLGADIAPGASLGGFQLVSPNPPDYVSYSAYDASGSFYTGFTTGPVKPLAAWGDVNADGAVDTSDVVLVLETAGGLPATLKDLGAGDVAPVPSSASGGFGDGALTVADALRILRHIHGLETRWP